MTLRKTYTVDSIQWLPAERLGHLNVDAAVRPWLIGKAGEAVTARALRDAERQPSGLWARRTRVTLRKAPLLMQELFSPAAGRP